MVIGVNTRTLRWFQLVGDGVTLTEVSLLEGVSQPGISRALARLEEQVGVPLLHKSGRALRLTAAGAAFKRHVDDMLHRLDDALAAAAQAVDPETGTVQLAFQRSLATWLVPRLVSSFRAKHPGVTFTLLQVQDDVVATILATGEADLVVSAARPLGTRAHRQRLMDEPLRLAVAADHPLNERTHICLSELAEESFLMLRSSSLLRQQSEQLCRAAGFEPSIGFEGDDLPSLRGFVAAGLGVAILPSSGQGFADAESGPVRYIEIDDALATREIGLAWPADRTLLASAELFRQHVIDLAHDGELPEAAFALQVQRGRHPGGQRPAGTPTAPARSRRGARQ